MKIQIAKFNNSTSVDNKTLPVSAITSIAPVIDRQGKPAILVHYFDDEYCLDASLFCDSIDFETVEI
jgi:hypothetical protein